ncbi:DUF397 domain-containing protein [Nocardiopsis composta]|uniref:DUF397 domain-containing protein n=1 Tax=Nocardiopsis composta TaxID=157465 RepID=A0A7W8VF20_9ACTN|nr:DUF397 domain-containing protein [Nocardiopsis composta]MBB5433947.1 hypothetical protein [Nocardiopsis composta]
MLDHTWHKSTYSGGTHQNCLEGRKTGNKALIRDTQNRHLGHLEFPAAEWKAFLAAVKG